MERARQPSDVQRDAPAGSGRPAGRSVQAHLLALVLGVLLPVLLFGGAAAWRMAEAEQARIEERATNSAREVAAGLDIVLSEVVATARVLAGSETLATGDLAAFHPRAVEAARVLGGAVVGVRDADSRQVLNSAVPWGAPLPPSNLAAIDAEAARTGTAVLSDGYAGRIDPKLWFSVVVPLEVQAGQARFLSLSVPAERVQRVVEGVITLTPGGVARVVDRRGVFLAHNPDPDRWIGQPATLRPPPDSGVARVSGLDEEGEPALLFSQPTAIAGWRAGIAVRKTELRAPLMRALWATVAGAAAALLAALALAWLHSRRIGRSIAALAQAGAALERDAAVPALQTPVREVNRVGAALAAAAAARRAKDAVLAERDARLHLALEAGRLGVFDRDLRTGVLHWSPRLRVIWGVGPDTPLSYEVFRAGLHPEDRARVEATLAAAADPAGDGRYEDEYRVIGLEDHPGTGATKGKVRHVAVRGQAEFRDGRAVRLAGTVADVSAQREAEAVLSRDRAGLERLVAERTRELEAAQLRLAQAQRMEALGQLAGGIAHDFNNVLQAVQGGASLLERRPADAAGVRRLARMIMDAAERGAVITGRLLAFARRGELRAEPVDPLPLLTGLREILAHTLGAGVEVRVEAPAGLPPLLADKGQLETVLVNLATNARDAMGGGGTVTFRAVQDTAPRDAASRDISAGRFVRLSVSDTGTGMDAATLARASEPFFTTKPVGKGTGLGLAMARGFAEQSGGSLAISSAPGEGTTVTLWLPAAEEKTGSQAQPGVAEAGQGAPGTGERAPWRVLVADDEVLVRELLAEQLEAAGCAVLCAAGGAEALALLDAGEHVDLVVSDLSMPGMDGIALIREAQRRRPGLPAILLTGYAGNAAEIAVGGALSGSFSLLRKPVQGKVLADRVVVLLEAAAAHG